MLLQNTPRMLYLLFGCLLSWITEGSTLAPAADTGSFLCARWTEGDHLSLFGFTTQPFIGSHIRPTEGIKVMSCMATEAKCMSALTSDIFYSLNIQSFV